VCGVSIWVNVVNALVCGARRKSSPWYVDPRSGSGMTFFEGRGDVLGSGMGCEA
jgi:hypothetical protein